MRRLTGSIVVLALIATILYLGNPRPRVVLFAFILTTLGRILLVAWFLRMGRSSKEKAARVRAWTRPPTPREIRWAEGSLQQPNNVPTDLVSNLVLLGSLSLFAFLLVHANDQQIQAGRLFRELGFAGVLTLLYTGESLLLRQIPIDLEMTGGRNYLFSSPRLTFLALAILFAGGYLAFAVTHVWPAIGLLMLFKLWLDSSSAKEDEDGKREPNDATAGSPEKAGP